MSTKNEALIFRQVHWQRPFLFQNVLDLTTHLASIHPRGALIWEIRSNGGKISYFIGMRTSDQEKMVQTVQSYGDIRFSDISSKARSDVDLVKTLHVSKPTLSLRVTENLALTRAVLAAMTQVKANDTIAIQVVIGRVFSPSALPNKVADPHASIFSVLCGNIPPASNESRNLIKEKVSSHRVSALIRIGAKSTFSFQSENYLRNVVSALRVMESSGVRISALNEKPDYFNRAIAPWHYAMKLSVKEIANFFLLPTGEEELPGISGLHPKYVPAPDWITPPNDGVKRSFGINVSANSSLEEEKKAKVLHITPRDSLEHTLILGPTGSGKSNVMLRLIIEDISAGRSVLVIDPKSDLINDVLSRIPESRMNDVVVIDPSDSSPVGFNPLSFSHTQSPQLVADAILAVFKDIFSDSWGIRTQDILTSALLSLSLSEDASLLMLPALLVNETYRHKITKNLTDQIGLKPFWEAFDAMGKAERNQHIAPVLNKMRQFLLRPALRNVLGQTHPKFSLSDLFYQRKIVLVPLNKGLIGSESAQLLGSLIVGLTWTLALSRAQIPPERRHIVSLFIDELQDYLRLPTDLSDALAQARGLGVGITLAHQYRSQLPTNIKAGIDANTHNRIIFGLNAADAKEMSAMAINLSAEDFMLLPRYHIYTNYLSNGKQTGWISAKTFPPNRPLRDASDLKAYSMQRYGKNAAEIETEYLQILGITNDNQAEASKKYPNVGRIKRRQSED